MLPCMVRQEPHKHMEACENEGMTLGGEVWALLTRQFEAWRAASLCDVFPYSAGDWISLLMGDAVFTELFQISRT